MTGPRIEPARYLGFVIVLLVIASAVVFWALTGSGVPHG